MLYPCKMGGTAQAKGSRMEGIMEMVWKWLSADWPADSSYSDI